MKKYNVSPVSPSPCDLQYKCISGLLLLAYGKRQYMNVDVNWNDVVGTGALEP